MTVMMIDVIEISGLADITVSFFGGRSGHINMEVSVGSYFTL